jgi:hypothetical protein
VYLEIDEGFLGHRKTLRFCSLMQNPEASVFLLRLWTWACRSAPSGSLDGMEPYDIEMAVSYRNLDGKCYAAMVAAGFIDEANGKASEIHGWTERTGGAIKKMEGRATYLKQWRDDRRTGSDRRREQPTNSIETVSEQFADKVEALTKQPSPVQSSPDQTRQEPDPRGSAEPAKPASPPAPALLTFPTVRGARSGATEWPLTQREVNLLGVGFPDLDVMAECRKALVWAESNKADRKTASGMLAFLNRWMTTAQNGGRSGRSGRAPPGPAIGHVRAEPGKHYPSGVQDL